MDEPAYAIRTDRLLLRCYEPADASELSALVEANLKHLAPWMPWAHQPPTIDNRLTLIRRSRAAFDSGAGDLLYGIFHREGALLGGIGLHARIGPGALEIGYWVGAMHEGHGFVTEAAGALTRVALEFHRVSRVEIHCDPANVRSAAVPRRLGYTHDATLRKRAITVAGKRRDTMVWSLFDDELASSPAGRVGYRAHDALGRVLQEG